MAPLCDMPENADFARRPNGGDNMSNNCNCGCQSTDKPNYTPVPPNGCQPYPSYPPFPYPYDCCPPVNPGVGSIEARIAKLSKKSATIRKMIDNLVNKNKSIVISIGCGASYNFGTYLNSEGSETEYGKMILEALTTELEAIKNKIVELTAELEVEDESTGGVEGTILGG